MEAGGERQKGPIEELPDELICPITFEPMLHPMMDKRFAENPCVRMTSSLTGTHLTLPARPPALPRLACGASGAGHPTLPGRALREVLRGHLKRAVATGSTANAGGDGSGTNAQLNTSLDETPCDSCGASLACADAKFCSECGASATGRLCPGWCTASASPPFCIVGAEHAAVVRANALKAEGNSAFNAQEYSTARDLYTQAIRLQPGNHVLFSNRSATFAKAEQWGRALDDAIVCTRAVEEFEVCLELEPDNTSYQEALADAKRRGSGSGSGPGKSPRRPPSRQFFTSGTDAHDLLEALFQQRWVHHQGQSHDRAPSGPADA
eukprot:gene1506-2810_t